MGRDETEALGGRASPRRCRSAPGERLGARSGAARVYGRGPASAVERWGHLHRLRRRSGPSGGAPDGRPGCSAAETSARTGRERQKTKIGIGARRGLSTRKVEIPSGAGDRQPCGRCDLRSAGGLRLRRRRTGQDRVYAATTRALLRADAPRQAAEMVLDQTSSSAAAVLGGTRKSSGQRSG